MIFIIMISAQSGRSAHRRAGACRSACDSAWSGGEVDGAEEEASERQAQLVLAHGGVCWS